MLPERNISQLVIFVWIFGNPGRSPKSFFPSSRAGSGPAPAPARNVLCASTQLSPPAWLHIVAAVARAQEDRTRGNHRHQFVRIHRQDRSSSSGPALAQEITRHPVIFVDARDILDNFTPVPGVAA